MGAGGMARAALREHMQVGTRMSLAENDLDQIEARIEQRLTGMDRKLDTMRASQRWLLTTFVGLLVAIIAGLAIAVTSQ